MDGVDDNVEKSENIYRIIYGHFYNNEDKFLFKKVHDGKIIWYKVSRCNKGELWHNKLNQLYIANYFKDAKKTAILLNNDISQYNVIMNYGIAGTSFTGDHYWKNEKIIEKRLEGVGFILGVFFKINQQFHLKK